MLGDSSTKLHLFYRPCSTSILAQQCYDMPCHTTKQCQNHQLITTHISSTTKDIYTNNTTMHTRVHWKVFIFPKSVQNRISQGFVANINRTSWQPRPKDLTFVQVLRFLSLRYWGLKMALLGTFLYFKKVK